MKTKLLLLFLTVLTASARGQSLVGRDRFQRLSVEQGLSSSVVYAILQDQRGFLWLGTQDGLNRYDGYAFTTFRSDPSDSASLAPGYVRALCQDRAGRIWVGSGGGLAALDPRSGRVRRYTHQLRDGRSPANLAVETLALDRDGTVWAVAFGGGLFFFDEKRDRFVRYRFRQPLRSKPVLALLADRAGALWLGTQGSGLFRLDPRSGAVTAYRHDPTNPTTLSGDVVMSLAEDPAGRLWVGTEGRGLNRLDPSTGHVTRLPLGGSLGTANVWTLHPDRAGNLWIGTETAGLRRLNPRTGEIKIYHSDPKNTASLGSESVFSLHEDRAGTLWVGTYGGGLCALHRPEAPGFFHYQTDPAAPNAAALNVVLGLGRDATGRLWVGTQGGLQALRGRPEAMRAETPPVALTDEVHSLRATRGGTQWVGTFSQGALAFDPRTSKARAFPDITRPAVRIASRQMAVARILEDRAGVLWFSTEGDGLRAYDPRTGEVRVFLNRANDPTSLSNNYLTALGEAADGSLWIGTFGGGLCRLDAARRRFTRYLNDPKNGVSLSSNHVSDLHVEPSGRVWVGTFGGGLNALDPRTGRWQRFTESEGLPNNVVNALLPDGRGNLWISTNKGLCRFTPPAAGQPARIRAFDGRDGLQNNEFTMGAGFRDHDGWLYFGGINGFNAFHPDSLRPNPYRPPVVLTAFRVFEKPHPLDTLIAEKRSLTLDHTQNFFSFEFAALNFVLPEKNKYAYRMEGFDPGWVEAGTRRYAAYTNLPAGTYTFRVKAANNDGLWNEQGTALTITVVPPFWQTGWFRALVLVGLLGLVYGLLRARWERERRANELRRVRAEAETRALRAQMNPHFIFNCLNTVDGYILTNRQDDASRFLQKFSQLIRRVLEQSRQEFIPISQELETLELYVQLEEERSEGRFRHEFEVDEAVRSGDYHLPPMLLQPFLENAILHGLRHKTDGPGLLRLRLSVTGTQLRVVVEDNGIGRAASATINAQRRAGRESLGSRVSTDRLATLQVLYGTESRCEYVDLNPGTMVMLTLPLIPQ